MEKQIFKRPLPPQIIINLPLIIKICNKCQYAIYTTPSGKTYCTCPSGKKWS